MKEISENILVMTDPMHISQEGDQGTRHLPDADATSREAERSKSQTRVSKRES